MNLPFVNFSIETVGVNSQGCWHETVYRVRNLHAPITEGFIWSLAADGFLGSGQELKFDIGKQERIDSGDGLNFYFQMPLTRVCDSSD